jgi:single-stranded DNA-specific DHH superfamily exonuclease
LRSLAPVSARATPVPIFRTSRVEIVDGPRRLKERHLKMAFKQDGRVLRGIAWRASERESFVAEHRRPSTSRFRSRTNVQRERYSAALRRGLQGSDS